MLAYPMKYIKKLNHKIDIIFIVIYNLFVFKRMGEVHMKNKRNLILVIGIILIVLVVVAVIFIITNNAGSLSGKPSDIIDKVYAGVSDEVKASWQDIATKDIDVTNIEQVEYNTGLESIEGIKSISVSETSSQYYPYSFVVLRLEKDADVEAYRNNIYESINTYKWTYTYADKLAVTNVGRDIFAVMGKVEEVDAIVQSLKQYAEECNVSVGNVLEKVEE